MELLLTLFIMIASFFLMSMGTLFFNKRIKGSCGGDDESCTCSALEQKMCKALKSSGSDNL